MCKKNKVNQFQKRLELTNKIESIFSELFCADDVDIVSFGMESILKGNKNLLSYLSKKEREYSKSERLVKFAPDFIVLKKTAPQQLYYVDIKHSVTPLCYNGRLKEIQKTHANLNINRANVGVVAKEALKAYEEIYDNTIIIMASPYNPKVIMAQFVKNIKVLRIDERKRNPNSQGSQTPHTNIYLDSFEPINDFFLKLNIKLNNVCIEKIKNEIKKEGIQCSNSLYAEKEIVIKNELKKLGCTWIE